MEWRARQLNGWLVEGLYRRPPRRQARIWGYLLYKFRDVILPGSAKIRLRSQVKEVNMYAVIKTGGKQYRVAAGEKIKVEQIAADVGQEIVIDQVLAVGNGAELKVGTPLVSGATVTVTVLQHGKHDKVRIFKMRRRKHYQKRQGHRQQFTELLIGAIAG